MGLFDRAKKAMSGAGDWAAQAQAASQMAGAEFGRVGYTDGTLPTMENAAEVSAKMQIDHDVLNAYGQELNRIVAVGIAGTSVITDAVDTGEKNGGNPWYRLEVQVTLPGQEPYTVTKREMVPPPVLASYAVGTAHDVKVDPADPQKIAFTS